MAQFAAILLSRQSLRPNGQTPWVKQVVAAVAWLKKNNYGLTGSTGLQTWELLTAMAAREKLPLRLFVPLADPEEFPTECDSLTFQFDLDPELTELIPVYGSDKPPSPTSLMVRRDRLVVKQADLLVPVSVREDGGMANLLTVAKAFGRDIHRDFEIRHEERNDPLSFDFKGHPINPELKDFEESFVIHWTRGTNGPWPGERLADLYADILASSSWPRSGLATLQRIAQHQRIVASYRHMPAGTATVSFSKLSPMEAVPLMTWRSRYRQMSFEPYGIGFKEAVAESSGIRPVIYTDGTVDSAHVEDRWLRQGKGKITDWRQEKEYRIRGDFSFGGMSDKDIALFCKNPGEAEELRARFPYRVIPMFTPVTGPT